MLESYTELQSTLAETREVLEQNKLDAREVLARCDDWDRAAEKAAKEPCGDEKHCTCVPLLRVRIRHAEEDREHLRKANRTVCRVADYMREKMVAVEELINHKPPLRVTALRAGIRRALRDGKGEDG
jgi:hypothetical protein